MGLHRVRVYTTGYCSYCSAAKALLQRRGIAFEEIDVTDADELRRWLAVETSQRTVPQIFIDDRPIGGYTELAALDRAGQLMALVDS